VVAIGAQEGRAQFAMLFGSVTCADFRVAAIMSEIGQSWANVIISTIHHI
jgi:hypothetical protein